MRTKTQNRDRVSSVNSEFTVSCIGLNKSFCSATILRNIQFGVPQGDILGLVGPNGAGKTTLLKILATLILPSSGAAFVCGRNVVAEAAWVRRVIGYVSSEERSFYWRLTGRDNLLFFAALQGITGRKACRRIDAILHAVGLKGMGSRRFHEYSTGMKQALGVARALLHDPWVLLLDEPTRSLSPDAARKVRGLLQHHAKEKGKAILISSHNLKEVEDLADRIAILHHGAISAMGTLTELRSAAGASCSADLDAVFQHFTSDP